MGLTVKITSIVSTLILLISGIVFLSFSLGSLDKNTLDMTSVQVEQRTNSRIANDITWNIKKLITDYNDYKNAKESQLEGDKYLIKTSVKRLYEEISLGKTEEVNLESHVKSLGKRAERTKNLGETAIAKYFERKAKADEVIQPKDDDKEEKKPDDVVKENPEDNPEEIPKDETKKEGADSVILKRPKNLTKAYFWPLTELHKNILMSSIVYTKNVLFNYFKVKVDDKGDFSSFSKMLKPYQHIGQNALAYSIFAQETNSGNSEKVLARINNIRLSSDSTKIFSSELAFTIIGLIFAKMQATSDITSASAWEPLNYNASKGFNETEEKILNWAIRILIKRQTEAGGWSNYHIESKILYDYDVFTTSLALYALSRAYQAGFTKEFKDEMFINGVNYLLKMQNQQVLKSKCALLDDDEKPFEDVNLRGWGFNYSAKPSVRTTAMSVAAIIKVMHVLHAMSQKHDEIIKKYKSAIVNGFSFIAKNWHFSDDFYTNWAVVQVCSSAGISRVGGHDIYSDIMTYFSDRMLITKINGFSFSNATFAYWCMRWNRQEKGFFKPMKIAGYQK